MSFYYFGQADKARIRTDDPVQLHSIAIDTELFIASSGTLLLTDPGDPFPFSFHFGRSAFLWDSLLRGGQRRTKICTSDIVNISSWNYSWT